MVVKQFGCWVGVESTQRKGGKSDSRLTRPVCNLVPFQLVDQSMCQATAQIVWALYGQATRAISTG